MFSALAFLLLCVAILFIGICYWYLTIDRNIPPGPLGYPYIGYPINFDNELGHFARLTQKYGPVFSYYAGSRLITVLNGFDVIKTLIVDQGDLFADRFNNQLAPTVLKKNPRGLGLIYTNGALWKEQRRFALSTFRDLGIGKPLMEQCIVEEADKLIEEFSTVKNQPIDLKRYFIAAVANVTNQLLFGERYDYKDKTFFDILDKINNRGTFLKLTLGLAYQPWMWLQPSFRRMRHETIRDGKKLSDHVIGTINKHKQTLRDDDEPQSYVDAYILKQRKGDGEFFDDEQLVQAVQSVFFAGTETTATTLRWLILFCCAHPDVQEKIYQEVINEVGDTVQPTTADRTKLAFTEATILEVQRMASLFPFFQRKAVLDVHYKQFRIPKDSIVITNMASVHGDATLFPQPELFRPERFLVDGKIKQPDWFIPFGIGKRICLGEALARMELLLFFSSLIQRFKFKFPPGEITPTNRYLYGMTTQPLPFRVIISDR